jgi:hemerythrin
MENLPKLESKNKFIELSEDELVNVEIIDNQHKSFTELVDELYSLLGSKKNETIKYLINNLVDDLKLHFETEEILMKEKSYINFFSHKMEHDRFLNKIIVFKQQLDNGKVNLNLELLKSCKTWFHNHIKLNDKKLGDFLGKTK